MVNKVVYITWPMPENSNVATQYRLRWSLNNYLENTEDSRYMSVAHLYKKSHSARRTVTTSLMRLQLWSRLIFSRFHNLRVQLQKLVQDRQVVGDSDHHSLQDGISANDGAPIAWMTVDAVISSVSRKITAKNFISTNTNTRRRNNVLIASLQAKCRLASSVTFEI